MLLVLSVLVSALSSAAPAPGGKAPVPAVDSEMRRMLLESRLEEASQRLEARLKQDPKDRAAAGLLAALLVGVDDKRARELQSRLGPAKPDPVIPPSEPVKAGKLAFVVTSRLRLRTAARANAAVSGWVAMGAPVRVERISGEWARVRVGHRTFHVEKEWGTLVHPDRWSDALDTGREGFLSLAHLDGTPPDLNTFRASAQQAQAAGEHDLAASYLLRAWSLHPQDPSVQGALLDSAIAAERYSVAVLVSRPPPPFPAPPRKAEAAEEDVAEEEGEAPAPPYTAEAQWVFGCRGSLPVASLESRTLGDGKRAAKNSCATVEKIQPECRPTDRRPEQSSNPEENDRFDEELAKEQERYDRGELATFNKNVSVLRAQLPDGPYVHVKLTVSSKGSPPPLYFAQSTYSHDTCDETGAMLSEGIEFKPLSLPRLTEGESVRLWFKVDEPINVFYSLASGESPEAISQRLRELQLKSPSEVNEKEAPGFWMMLAPAFDECDSCKFI